MGALQFTGQPSSLGRPDGKDGSYLHVLSLLSGQIPPQQERSVLIAVYQESGGIARRNF